MIVGLAASGPHSNGFSLIRRVLGDDPPEADLLVPTRIYAPEVAALLDAVDVRAMCHVTGGGIEGNLPRVLPAGRGARIDEERWPEPAWLQRLAAAGVARDELRRVFNCGVGYLVVVPPGDAEEAIATAECARHAGVGDRRGRPGTRRPVRLGDRCCAARRPPTRCGSACSSPAPARNLQVLLDTFNAGAREARVVAVASTRPGVRALERAAAAGVPHDVFARSDDRDARLADWLDAHGVELVVCAGWMGILTPGFLARHVAINLHPALLPSFPGAHAIARRPRPRRPHHRRDGALRGRRGGLRAHHPASCGAGSLR